MSAIIAQLLAILGPILLKFLTDWLSGLFNKVAPSVSVTGDDAEDAAALVQAAHDATPRTRVFRRALLRRIKDHAPDIMAGSLSKADKKELKALAAQAE